MQLLLTALFLASILPAADPQFGTSTVSAGAGVAIPAGGWKTLHFDTGFSVTAEYELRLHKFIAATIGVENYILDAEHFGRFPMPDTWERVTLLPVGIRFLLPVASGRAELFAGTGGAPCWTSDDTLGGSYLKDAALWHVNGGIRIRLDSSGRFRLGPTVRHDRDVGRPTQQWVSLTAEFSYRF